MTEIDPESKAFLTWVRTKLKDRDFFDQLIVEIFTDLQFVYGHPDREQIIATLTKKMIRGSKEHGPPKKNKKIITREIIYEALDLIGWKMMEKYLDKKP